MQQPPHSAPKKTNYTANKKPGFIIIRAAWPTRQVLYFLQNIFSLIKVKDNAEELQRPKKREFKVNNEWAEISATQVMKRVLKVRRDSQTRIISAQDQSEQSTAAYKNNSRNVYFTLSSARSLPENTERKRKRCAQIYTCLSRGDGIPRRKREREREERKSAADTTWRIKPSSLSLVMRGSLPAGFIVHYYGNERARLAFRITPIN